YKYLFLLSAGVFVIICIVFAAQILDLLMWKSFYGYFFRIFTTAGFPEHLSGAISIWLTVAVIFLVPVAMSSILFRRTAKGVLIVAGALSGWFVLQYVLSLPKQGEYFNPITGESRFKYSRRPDGSIKLF